MTPQNQFLVFFYEDDIPFLSRSMNTYSDGCNLGLYNVRVVPDALLMHSPLTLSLTAQVIYDLAFSMENYSKIC
jgi:hypothetical protein